MLDEDEAAEDVDATGTRFIPSRSCLSWDTGPGTFAFLVGEAVLDFNAPGVGVDARDVLVEDGRDFAAAFFCFASARAGWV